MAANEGMAELRSMRGGKAVILFASLIPLVFDVGIIRVKFIRQLLVIAISFAMFFIAYRAGKFWYKAVSLDKGEYKSPEDGEMIKRGDLFASVVSILVALGVLVFLRELLTHEVARTFSEIMSSPDED